jgi:hypothetical protein
MTAMRKSKLQEFEPSRSDWVVPGVPLPAAMHFLLGALNTQ